MKNFAIILSLLATSTVFADSIDFGALDCKQDTYQGKALEIEDMCLYRLCWAARFKKTALQYSDDLSEKRVRRSLIKSFTEIRDDNEETAQEHIEYLTQRCDQELSTDLAIKKTIVLSLKSDMPIVKKIEDKLKQEGNL